MAKLPASVSILTKVSALAMLPARMRLLQAKIRDLLTIFPGQTFELASLQAVPSSASHCESDAGDESDESDNSDKRNKSGES